MRAIHATFRSLTLLILLVTAIHADEEADYRLSFDCAANNTRPGASPQTMFVNNNDKSCKCMPAGTNDGPWTKCPSPSAGLRSGLAICVNGVGCKMECAQDAIPKAGDCIPYSMAPGGGISTLTDEDCSKVPDADPTDVIGAYPGGSCLCKSPNWHRTDGGTVCNGNIPENSFATCSRPLRNDKEVGDSTCSFRCMPGFITSEDQKSCIVGAPPQEKGQENSSPPQDGGQNNNTSNAGFAQSCPTVKTISYASTSARCGCESRMNLAKKRAADAVQCMPPKQHGRTGCKNVGAGSMCTPACDAGFKISADNTDCVLARQNLTKSELECGTDAGAIQYLSADPNGGCMCKDVQDSTFCGVAFGDLDAEMMCFDTTDLGGNREVKCAVKCSDKFTAKDKNTCEPSEVEGDTVTMAGTASPNSGEAACASKVYSLSGKGGCKCDTSAPQGGTECIAGRNAYPVCMYERGSGEEAACGIACVPGKNLFGNTCR
ncbi:hypothetical protein B0H11DRAFT_1985617 [Mycena galericulata]|nr:hypothetical protein B0H11DRAFT_1985617 [Mycena galericulata]